MISRLKNYLNKNIVTTEKYYYNFEYDNIDYSFIYERKVNKDIFISFSVIERNLNKLPKKFSILDIYERLEKLRKEDSVESYVDYNNYYKENNQILWDIRQRFILRKPMDKLDLLYNEVYENMNKLGMFDINKFRYKEIVC